MEVVPLPEASHARPMRGWGRNFRDWSSQSGRTDVGSVFDRL